MKKTTTTTPPPIPVAVATVLSGTERLALYRWGTRAAFADSAAPAVVLVHGYPDSARVWDGVARRLAAKGFAVWAYDVRGAGASSRPTDTRDYRLAHLMDDLLAVIDATGRARVHLVGHDWGALQGWEASAEARLAPRLKSFTSVAGLSLDHVGDTLARRYAAIRDGTASLDTYRATARQVMRSWYVWAFHAPLVPLAWGLGLGRFWPHLLARLEGRPEAAGAESSQAPTRALDGAAGMALYRANVLPRLRRPQPKRILVPVQAIHAAQDPFLAADLLDGAAPWVDRLVRHEVPGGHWLPLTDPARLAGLVAGFVGEIEAGSDAAPAVEAEQAAAATTP